MNFSRLALAAVSAWVLSLVLGFVVNTWVMADIAQAHAHVFRPEAEMNLPLGFAAQLVAFFAFAYMYAKGYEGTGGLQEGLRFGVLVGLLLIGFATTWNYVVLPVSATLGVYWAVDMLLEMAIYGAVVGLVYRPRASVPRA
jgi:hypothetical protein